jgi:hypothetical protein
MPRKIDASSAPVQGTRAPSGTAPQPAFRRSGAHPPGPFAARRAGAQNFDTENALIKI